MIKNLVIVWDFDPVMFSLGSLEIRYYGLMWALALLLGGWFFGNFCKREGLKSELADSIFITQASPSREPVLSALLTPGIFFTAVTTAGDGPQIFAS